MVRKAVRLILLIILLFPFILWVIWLFQSQYPMKIFILDKTVLTKEGLEHRSFNWILDHMKITKPNGDLYKVEKDYMGFFPLEDFQFDVKDLTDYTDEELDSMASYYEMAYYTDTYGIYHNEWYKRGNDKDRSELIYGGLHRNDFALLRKMVEKHKTVITEFSLYALPTSYALRQKCEELLGLQWTGWVGRYFSSLDTIKNKELPPWVWKLYRKQHGGKYPFKDGGLVYVHTSDKIVILDEKRHMNFPIPIIYSDEKYQKSYNLPDNILYPFWFAVTLNARANNNVMSVFSMKTNGSGDSILNYYHIPKTFVASVEHHSGDSNYYYFSADFCDNQIGMMSSKLRGIRNFRSMFYSQIELENRKRFFWEYYIPLIRTAINEHRKRQGKEMISVFN